MKNKTQELLPSIAKLACDVNKEPCALSAVCANVSDEEMVGRAKISKECFSCLVERYDWKMKTYVKRITGASEETAQDIVQEVFLKVYANLDKFDCDMKFSSWIYRIAHNQAVNKYLYEKKRRTESLTWDDNGELKNIIKDTRDTWKEIQRKDVRETLHTALGEVSEKYQEVITLNYLQEKSYQEISAQLDKPVNTIGTMLNRGKKMLKKELLSMGVSRDVALV
jgi:RNA polymerase sigma-70 factor (ECF subfamily)